MAKSKKEITAYIKKFCELHSLEYSFFFHEDNFDDIADLTLKPAPIFGKDSIESKLPLLSELFGLSYDEILNTSDEGLKKWYNKYEFFYYLPRFESACYRSTLGKGVEEIMLLKAIFGQRVKAPYPKRYDGKNIKARAIDKLKEIDMIMPGTYHPYAKMNRFQYETSQFCTFPNIDKLVRSLLEMIARAKELFFKAQKQDLEECEILEYNFLVTVLELKDVASNHYLYYRNVVALREVHKKENYHDFYSYVKLTGFNWLSPWRAKEFVDNPILVQDYINEYAVLHNDFSQFAKTVGMFCCSFVWEDEPWVKDDFFSVYPSADMSDPEMQKLKELFEMDEIPYQKPTFVYINKTAQELNGDEEYIEKCLRLVGSPKQGGIMLPKRELPLRHYNTSDMVKMMNHIYALGGQKND